MNGLKEEITDFNNQQVVVGETYELHFANSGIFSAIKQFLIKQKLDSMAEFKTLDLTMTDRETIATVQIVENPLPLAFIIGAIIALAAGTLIWLSLGKVYKIASTPLGVGVGVALPVVAIVALLGVLGFSRG